MTILDEIAAHARVRVEKAKAAHPLEEVREAALALPAGAHEFRAALEGPQLAFICEVKKASPSKSVIDPVFDYVGIARAYEAAGAECISCLTEPKWFLGSDEIFREVRAAQGVPMIRKDFTVDEYQIYEAKLLGAQAVLLICSLLAPSELERMLSVCERLGLDALVEAHDEAEVRMAVAAGAQMVGVNNRNLKDFSVDVGNAGRLRELVPQGRLFVAESGVTSAADAAAVAAAGADAVLVGEALMRVEDKAALLAEFRAAAKGAL